MKDLSSKLSSVIFDYLCSFTELIHELKIDDHDVDASPAYSQGKYNSTKYQCFPGFLTILILHEIYQNQMEIRKNGIYIYNGDHKTFAPKERLYLHVHVKDAISTY